MSQKSCQLADKLNPSANLILLADVAKKEPIKNQ